MTITTTGDRVDVLSWFGDRVVKSNGGRAWTVRCPCGRHKHDDKAPSGSLALGDDVPWIFTCGYGSTAEEILAGLGKTLAVTYPDYKGGRAKSSVALPRPTPHTSAQPPAPPYAAPKRNELPEWIDTRHMPLYEFVTSYYWEDRSGGVLMVKDRYKGLPGAEKTKDFRVRSVQQGRWVDRKPDGVSLVPYGWLSVVAAPNADVLSLEGEKDVDTAHSLGLPAVFIPDGLVDLDVLRDRVVVVIPDADVAGDLKATKIQDRLKGVASRVVRVALPNPGGIEKFDLTDFVESGGTADDVQRIVRQAVDVLPPEVVPFDRLRAEVMQFYERGMEPGVSIGISSKLDAHIKLLAPEIVTVTGAPGAGKSTFTNHVLARTSEKHGWRWLIYSPEQSPSRRLVSKLLQAFYGLPFLDGPSQRISPAQVEAGLEHIRRHFVIIEPQEYGCNLDRLLELGVEMNRREKLNGVMFDPYNVIAATSREAGESAHDFVNQFMAKLRTFTQAEKMVAVVVAHPKKLEKLKTKGKDGEEETDYAVVEPWDISDSAHWNNHSDKILSLWRPRNRKAIENGDCSVDINIKKVRWQPELGTEGVVTLYYDYRRGRYLDEPPRRADSWPTIFENN